MSEKVLESSNPLLRGLPEHLHNLIFNVNNPAIFFLNHYLNTLNILMKIPFELIYPGYGYKLFKILFCQLHVNDRIYVL